MEKKEYKCICGREFDNSQAFNGHKSHCKEHQLNKYGHLDNVNKIISKHLIGKNVYNQEKIDNIMIKLDGTENKEKLGANAILGVSIATLKAAANSLNIPLYQYIGGISGILMPIPMMNIINGGKHSDNNLNIQDNHLE